MTGLVCAVGLECDEIRAGLSRSRRLEYGGLVFFSGLLSGRRVVLTASGVGKTNAAHAATLLIEKFRPAMIVNFGVGGAYPGTGAGVCGIAVADSEIYGDEGVVTRDGFKDMRDMGMALVQAPPGSDVGAGRRRRRIYNRIPIQPVPVRKAYSALKRLSFSPLKGPFVTVSTVTGTAARAAELQAMYGAVCENMEGASVAHVCVLHRVPFLEIRGMSNLAGERDKRRWRLKEAAVECQRAVMGVLGRW
ncbi:MAG: futalosine hydrolase [Nitrospirae bacterium]|nr:futalosine hydrolase [Nitrospirota bacterium]